MAGLRLQQGVVSYPQRLRPDNILLIAVNHYSGFVSQANNNAAVLLCYIQQHFRVIVLDLRVAKMRLIRHVPPPQILLPT